MFKNTMLFISHAEKDCIIIEKFVNLLYDMGVPRNNIFCSSLSEVGVPIKQDIYDYLRNLLDSEQIIPIFMLSDNYYASASCLNEMGAVWMKKIDYYIFLLPGFKFIQIKGAINPRKRGVLLEYNSDSELQNLKHDLNLFREQISKFFLLEQNVFWERKRDEFILQIHSLKLKTINIDLDEIEGFCIGKYEHEGCRVSYDSSMNKIVSKVNFKKTKAKLCATIIYTGVMNLTTQYKMGGQLIFYLKASDTIHNIEVECVLKNRSSHRVKIETSANWEKYNIDLSAFGGDIKEWEELKEIKFLLERKNISGGTIEVKNMVIE